MWSGKFRSMTSGRCLFSRNNDQTRAELFTYDLLARKLSCCADQRKTHQNLKPIAQWLSSGASMLQQQKIFWSYQVFHSLPCRYCACLWQAVLMELVWHCTDRDVRSGIAPAIYGIRIDSGWRLHLSKVRWSQPWSSEPWIGRHSRIEFVLRYIQDMYHVETF